jgi:hypothetical protein
LLELYDARFFNTARQAEHKNRWETACQQPNELVRVFYTRLLGYYIELTDSVTPDNDQIFERFQAGLTNPEVAAAVRAAVNTSYTETLLAAETEQANQQRLGRQTQLDTAIQQFQDSSITKRPIRQGETVQQTPPPPYTAEPGRPINHCLFCKSDKHTERTCLVLLSARRYFERTPPYSPEVARIIPEIQIQPPEPTQSSTPAEQDHDTPQTNRTNTIDTDAQATPDPHNKDF